MNRPVRTTTPSGEEIVILPADDYDRLVETAEDAADVSRAERALADFGAGRGEALTHAEVAALLRARSPLAFWRKRRQLTQKQLAAAAGVSQAYLAQIESRRRLGDVELYQRFAEALGLGIEDLVPPPRRRRRKP